MGQSGAITSLKNNRSSVKRRSDLSANALKKSNEKKENLIDPKKATPEQLAHIRMEQEEYKRQQLLQEDYSFYGGRNPYCNCCLDCDVCS